MLYESDYLGGVELLNDGTVLNACSSYSNTESFLNWNDSVTLFENSLVTYKVIITHKMNKLLLNS